MPKLSSPLIAAAQADRWRGDIWDDSLPGSVAGKASGCQPSSSNIGNRSGRSRDWTIGALGNITLDKAASSPSLMAH